MNNIKQAIIKLETILENGNEKENRLFVKYNTIKKYFRFTWKRSRAKNYRNGSRAEWSRGFHRKRYFVRNEIKWSQLFGWRIG